MEFFDVELLPVRAINQVVQPFVVPIVETRHIGGVEIWAVDHASGPPRCQRLRESPGVVRGRRLLRDVAGW